MKFFRALRVDLRRSLIQKKTLLLLALLLGYMCFNASQYLFGTQAGAGAPLILQQAVADNGLERSNNADRAFRTFGADKRTRLPYKEAGNGDNGFR